MASERIAVFLPNWVGDAVMATPTLRALRKRFGPEAHLIGIMKPPIAETLRGNPHLDEVWAIDRAAAGRLGNVALLTRMRRPRLDWSVHLTNDLASAVLARVAGVRERAGYARNGRGRLLTRALEPPRDGKAYRPVSALDYYLEIAYAAGCEPEGPRMELAVTLEDDAVADHALGRAGLAERPFVAFNSSGAYGAAKLWPEEYCAEAARRIADELDTAVIVLCGPAERESAGRIADAAAHPLVRSLAGEPVSIGLSKAVVRRSRALVSTDSGPRHFGAAFGVPVVALFGPTHIAWSDTHYPGEVRLQRSVACGPCQQRTCPEGHHRCMRELSVDDVVTATRRVLA